MTDVVLVNPDHLARQMQSRYLSRRGFAVTELERDETDVTSPAAAVVVDAVVQGGAMRAVAEGLAGPDVPRVVFAIVPGRRERFALQRRVGAHVDVLVEADGQHPLLDRCCDELGRVDATIAMWARFSLRGLAYRLGAWVRRLFGGD